MQVSQTSATPANTAASAARATTQTKTLGYDSFLKLLVAQMKNQDPLKPMDATQTVSQLASFSSVEQMVNANAKLTSLLNASMVTQAASLIGKTVMSADGQTSGVVAGVQTSDAGMTAVLQDGKTVSLTPGVWIG